METLKNTIPKLLLFAIVAIILISCEKKDDRAEKVEALTLDLIEVVSADSLESYVRWMENMGTRFALADNRREVALSIADKLTSFGYSNVRLDSFQIYKVYREISYRVWEYNIIASIEGSETPGKVYLLGGHFDSILRTGDPFTEAPGANDNASGTAAMLEIARVLLSNDFQPKSTIEFLAFGSEELGLFGSYKYANMFGVSGRDLELMLNNDMIAYEPSSDRSAWQVNILDYENSESYKIDAKSIVSKYTSLSTYTNNTYNRASDSYPFSRVGVPALFFHNDASDPNYHTLQDIADNCNFEYCREVTLISLAILLDKTY